uniref:Lipocalin n=1 Tax=Haemonchus contortus TaxID=6289 RepID=A0A7I4YGI8_HAECO
YSQQPFNMERLLFAFVLIGTTLACSPVPEPKVKGKGHDIVYVTLVTNQTYNPAGISTFMSDFSGTKIQQYSASVGNFSDLNCTNTDGYFTWTFKLTDANCSIVKAWVKQIVASSSFYKAGYTSCGSETFTAYVTLIQPETYTPRLCSLLHRMNRTAFQFFASQGIGDFSEVKCTDVNGHFAQTYTLLNANCTRVKTYLEERLSVNNDFINGTFTCVPAGTSTSANANLIEITAPPPTAAKPTPFVIVPGGALPVAPVVIPYQSDYEETVEHVEESVSSFESMSITSL